jgi:hypothetical protein
MGRFQDYTNAGFLRHQSDYEVALVARAAAKWWLEFVRNFIVVVGFFYIAAKSDSALLKAFSYVNCGVLLWYITAYFNTWSFRFFPYIQNKRLNFLVNATLWSVVYVAAWLSCIGAGAAAFKAFETLQRL